jgi:hypothetical protein
VNTTKRQPTVESDIIIVERERFSEEIKNPLHPFNPSLWKRWEKQNQSEGNIQ